MKRILLISDEYYPKLGGAGVVARSYFNLLSEHYQIDLITASGYNPDALFSFKKKSIIWPLQYIHIFKKIDFIKYDLIILNDGPAQYAASLFFNQSEFNRTISIVHGFEKKLTHKKLLEFSNYKRNLVKTYSLSRNIVFVSDYIKSIVEIRLKLKFDDRYKIIYNWPIIYPIKNKSENKTLLTVGRVTKLKGYLRVYSIFKEMLKLDDSWHWTIVGDGDYIESLVDKVESDNLQKNITFLGSLPQQELAEVYARNRFFILLSEFDEAYGLVYLEAMLCGCYTFAYNRCGPKEIMGISNSIKLIEFDERDEKIANIINSTNVNDEFLFSSDFVFKMKQDFLVYVSNLLK